VSIPMKFRNIYLALIDQMPLRRFVRNLLKGHLRGIIHKRSHTTANGSPKVSYPKRSSAVRAAESMEKKHGKHFSIYKCIWCDGYHIGKNRDNK